MSIPYTSFLTEVVPYALDVAEPQAVFAVRSACIDFCERTLIWRTGFTVDITEGETAYQLDTPLDSRRAAVVSLFIAGSLAQPTSDEYLIARTGADSNTTEGLLGYYTESPSGHVILAGKPTIDMPAGLTGVQALAPVRDSDEIGLDYIYERWVETIAAGALSRLMMTAGQPYYNPQAAAQYKKIFDAGMNKAKAEVDGGNGRGRQRIQMRPFARGNYPWR